MYALSNHLWQSTVVAAILAAATLALRKNSARARYWLWLVASLKFLIPFSLLVPIGESIAVPAFVPPASPVVAEQMSKTFYLSPAFHAAPVRQSNPFRLLIAVWAAGAAILLVHRLRRWRKVHLIVRNAAPAPLTLPVPVRLSDSGAEPGVYGLFRPVLLLPAGLIEELAPQQFDAVVVHELCHVRYRDNLTAALHMAVETLFWFHPAVWWIGARLIAERERACDQAVLDSGAEPEVYAEGIVGVCRNHLASSLPCVSGVGGSHLHRRIAEIMDGSLPVPISRLRKILVTVVCASLAALPVLVGVLDTPRLLAQSGVAEDLRFEVASIRLSKQQGSSTSINTGRARFSTSNVPLHHLISFAYNVQGYQVIDAPAWSRDSRYDIVATYESAEDANIPVTDLGRQAAHGERVRARVRNLLADRFQLKLREEQRELPVYFLVVDKGGHKMKADTEGNGGTSTNINNGNGSMRADSVAVDRLAVSLSNMLGRPVFDRTNLTGTFTFELKWSDNSADPTAGPALVTAIREQLGLRLDSGKGPVKTYIVEHVERPSEN